MITLTRVFYVVALAIFVAAAIGIQLGTVNMVAAGLAFIAAGLLSDT